MSNRKRAFLSFDKAKKVVHKLGFKTTGEWMEFAKSNKRPENIPSNPQRTYKDVWKNWPDWLGK